MKKYKLINQYIILLMLTSLLVISLSLAWYTANEEVSADGVIGSVDGAYGLTIENSKIFRQDNADISIDENNNVILNDPYPLVDGIIYDLLPNEYFYLSISFKADKIETRNIKITIKDIIGDILTDFEGNKYVKNDGFYSMCDVFEISLDSIWIKQTDEHIKQDLNQLILNNNLTNTAFDTKYFNDSKVYNDTQMYVESLDVFEYANWDSIGVMTVTFKIFFDFNLVTNYDSTIPMSSISDKYFKFDSVIVLG